MQEETKEKTRKNNLSRKQVNGLLWLIAGMGAAPALLSTASSPTIYTDVLILFAVYAAAVYGGGTWLCRRYEGREQQLLQERDAELTRLASKYNKQIDTLVSYYNDDADDSNSNSLEALRKRIVNGTRTSGLSDRELRKIYSKRYSNYYSQFTKERKEYLHAWNKTNRERLVFKHFWGWVFVIVAISAILNFIYSVGVSLPESNASTLVSNTPVTYWNAQNIPIPHLQDANQYVSNPDSVLSQPVVDHINLRMKQLDEELGIESAVIVVNHIENDDPFRLAQDVGNNYGVGREDRGLVVVVGYLDHSINISPGRSLEADLTDAECRRLQQQYVIPGMRAELPDSAMFYLADALYATFKGKEMPEMSPLHNSKEDDSDEDAMAMGLYICLLAVWNILFVYKNKKYQWLGTASGTRIMANPFLVIEDDDSGVFFTGGGGGFSGGGGGFSGGSYGGGSFGGGGATSRW